ncbi:MAG: dockerin type I domain-containing protein, partial [Candidatus Latescibacteria bacterium]|nr:dockerin type I domain-containing protein [Candidatus Latescibacterota bacterium]
MLFSARSSLLPLSRNHLIALLCLVLLSPAHAATPDFNNDGQVNFLDFVLLSQRFGTQQNDPFYNTVYDLDNSGDVGFGDFVRFVQQFGTAVEPVLLNQHTLDP